MDYELGSSVLKQYAEDADWYDDFDLYEAQLRENLRDERRYGSTQQLRSDRARIVENLNILARDHLDISFNDERAEDITLIESAMAMKLDRESLETLTGEIHEQFQYEILIFQDV